LTAPIAPLLSLDARYHIDPDLFQQDLAGVLARAWQFVGHGSQLPDTGDYFAFEIAGQSLFCIRGRDGVPRTFYNAFQYRAHELVSGTGSTRVIVCPYHQWTYELTGALRAAPNAKTVPGVDRSRICLTETPTEDFHGVLFVNLDPDAAPMDGWFPGFLAELAAFVPHVDNLAPLEWMEASENCNGKVSIENYSECYHCPINQPTFAEGVLRPETYDIQPDPMGGYVLRHVTECQSLDRLIYPVDLSVPHADDHQSWFLWPMFSFQCYLGNLLNTYHWRVGDVDHRSVWRGWYRPGGAESDVIRSLAVQDRQTTVEEDIRLVDPGQRGLKSRGYRPGPPVLDPGCCVMSEHSIARLQQWMCESVAL
jgi:phenylpropionate dioxygenase-like ring-hydroxylating dioxygenase large terminal subunit